MKQFILDRLNKDNLWNIIFWIGMSLGFAISSFFSFSYKSANLALFFIWGSLIGFPILIAVANKTSSLGKSMFFNSKKKKLSKKQLPSGWFIPTTILGIAITMQYIPSGTYTTPIGMFFVILSTFSGFSMYFILKNCPISILFNGKFWQSDGRRTASNVGSYSSGRVGPSATELMTNPIYASRSSNIHNRYR